MTVNSSSSQPSLNINILEKQLKLNEQNQPDNPTEFSQALDDILANWTDHTSRLEPSQVTALKNLVARIINKVVIPENVNRKSLSVFRQIFTENPPIVVTIDNQSFLLPQTDDSASESSYLNDFINAKGMQKSSKPGKLGEEISIDQLIDSELLIYDNLEHAPISKEELLSILNYLETGTIESCKDNILRTLNLAKHFGIKSLQEKCANSLELIITAANFDEVWKACLSSPSPIPQLLPSCIEFIQENKSHQSSDEKINTAIQKIHSLFLSGLIKFKKSELNLIDAPHNTISITFEQIDIILKEYSSLTNLPSFKEMITKVTYRNYGDDDTADLSLFPNAKQLTLFGCSFNRIIALNAKEINISYCESFTTIEAPFAENIACTYCVKLTQITAPNAKEIYVHHCESFEAVEVPLAEKIIFGLCNKLHQITAPNVKEIDIANCKSLTSIETLLAEKINCKRCDNLSKIIALNAKEIDIEDCESLATIEIPLAEKITYTSCDNLSQITALSAKEIDVRYCISLAKIETPHAEEIIYECCNNLQQIIAPNAKKIGVYYNESLEVVDAPFAEKITCEYCKDLSQITAGNAKEINITSCESLAVIEASDGAKINRS